MTKMDLMKGTLDMMVLRTLRQRPMHGYAIARWIKRATEDVFQIKEGATLRVLIKKAGAPLDAPLAYMIDGERLELDQVLEDGQAINVLHLPGGG